MTETKLPDALATLTTKETAGMSSGRVSNNVSGAQGPGMRGCLHGERQKCGTFSLRKTIVSTFWYRPNANSIARVKLFEEFLLASV
jgi:hypothetical protein